MNAKLALIVTGPVIIGKNCNIENSIIMSDCKITSKVDLSSSIIAYGSEIEDNEIPKKHEFLLGERSHLKL